MKKRISIIGVTALILLLAFSMVACLPFSPDKEYLNNMNKWSFWKNDSTESIKQTAVYDIAKEHMLAGEEEGYTGDDKKVLIMGFDGARGDTMINFFRDTTGTGNATNSPNNLNNTNVEFSALNELAKTGGVYHMDTGGEDKATQQHTSTAPGWASMLTGVWTEGIDGGVGHGVFNNGEDYQLGKDTLMMEFAKKDYKTSFTAGWEPHFTEQYVNELKYLEKEENENVDMTYFHAKDKNKFLDHEIRDDMMKKITDGTDIVFGIFETIDSNGHNKNFDNSNPHYVNSLRSSDNYAYQVLQHLKSTPNYENEDWLIIMSTDHGGLNTDHGGQSLEERNIWMVSNKVVDVKHYSSDYTGAMKN